MFGKKCRNFRQNVGFYSLNPGVRRNYMKRPDTVVTLCVLRAYISSAFPTSYEISWAFSKGHGGKAVSPKTEDKGC